METLIGSRFRDTKENVFLDCALEERWFLGYKRDGFAIISNVKIGDVDSVCEDLSSLDFVETF